MQLDAPTAFFMGDFSKYHLDDPATGTVTPQPNVDNFNSEYVQPVIISTQDDQFALGAYTAVVLPDGRTTQVYTLLEEYPFLTGL